MRGAASRLILLLLVLAIAGPVELLSAPAALAAEEPSPTASSESTPEPPAKSDPPAEPEPTADPPPDPTEEPTSDPLPTPSASPVATPGPDPTTAPTASPSPGPTQSPAPSPAPTATPDPPPTAPATFTYPAPGPERVGSAGTVTVRWTEVAPLANRTIRQYYAAAIGDSCAGVPWTRAWTRSVSGTSLVVRKHVPGVCYQYRLVATPPGGGTAVSAVSGAVRVPGAWTGSFDLYRYSAFSTQRRWYWCVPASVQMMLNLIHGRSDQSYSNQLRYYRYGRPRRARLFSSLGLDPRSWMLTLNRYGGGGYRVVTSTSLGALMRYAARRNRLTGKPVGLLVGRGGHAWVMTGFRASSDPALSRGFRVTAIRTMGPLWPRQKYRNGYFDARPGKWFSMTTVPYLYGRYRDRLGSTPWDGRYVIVSP